MNRMRKKAVPALLAAVLTCAVPLNSWALVTQAQGPGETAKTQAELNGYTEEAWAGLMDNKLEYDEIDDLVKNFNLSIADAWDTFNDSVQDSENMIKNLKARQEIVYSDREDSKEKGETETAAEDSAEYSQLANMVYSLGTSLKKMKSTNSSSSRSIRAAQRSMAQSVRTLMITYDTMRCQAETLGEMVTLYEDIYNAAVVRRSVGTATENEMLKAKADWLSAKADYNSMSASADSLRRTLIMMCGWKNTDTPEIGSIPSADLSRIDSMNLQTDTDIAWSKNLDRADYLAESHSISTYSKTVRDQKEAELDETIRTGMQGLYDAVMQAKTGYDSASLSWQAAQQNKAAADAKYGAGMLSKTGYDQTLVQYKSAEMAMKAADRTLFRALSDYDWALKGYYSFE